LEIHVEGAVGEAGEGELELRDREERIGGGNVHIGEFQLLLGAGGVEAELAVFEEVGGAVQSNRAGAYHSARTRGVFHGKRELDVVLDWIVQAGQDDGQVARVDV